MPVNQFDKACRYLAKIDPLGFLCWLLGLSPADIHFIRWLDTRGIVFPGEPETVRDTVAHVEDVKRGQVPWAIVVEFQCEPDSLMFGRLMVYDGGVWLELKPTGLVGDRFELGAVVVNLTGQGRTARRSEWPEAGLLTALVPREVNLCTHDAGLTLDGIENDTITRAVLAFIPLMTGGADSGIIQRWINIASMEQDAKRRGDYGGLAIVFAELTGCRPAWKLALQGWNMVQSQQVLEWQTEAVVNKQRLLILRLLRIRFQTLPADLEATILAMDDLGQLDNWFDLASQAQSLADFRVAAGL